jgi:hypothetical protein
LTVATTAQATQKGLGWRKVLRAAIANNPFVKGEGLSPKVSRELLGHSQRSLFRCICWRLTEPFRDLWLTLRPEVAIIGIYHFFGA